MSRERMKVKTLAILVLSLSLVVLGATIGLGQSDVTLSMWSWRTEDVEEYENILSNFEEEHPNISVEFEAIKNTEYNTVLATSLEGEEGPDVMQLRAYGGLQRYVPFLMPLGDKVPALDEFSSSSIASATGREDGKVYGVPFANQVLGVYYNREIFDQYELEVPETWDEFIQVCETLKEEGVTPLANAGGAGWHLEILFGTFGPNFYGGNEFYQQVKNGETTFEDPDYVKALRKVSKLTDYMPPGYMGIGYSSQQAQFYTEQAAMFVGGSFEAGYFQEQNPDLDIGVFPAPPPSKDDPVYVGTWADGSYGINKRTEHKEEALELIKYLASKDFGQQFTNQIKQISSVPGVKPDQEKVPVIAQFTDMISKHEATPYLMLVEFRYESPGGSELLQSSLEGLMSGKKSPKEAATLVQDGLEEWYEPFQ